MLTDGSFGCASSLLVIGLRLISRCDSRDINSSIALQMMSQGMTDFDYDQISLDSPEKLAPGVILKNVAAYRDRLATRRTVRDSSDEPIDRSVIEACVLAAGSAPSGANHQPWHFACVSDRDTKRAIREAAEEEQEFYGGRAGETWLNDLKKIGTDASQTFLETAP